MTLCEYKQYLFVASVTHSDVVLSRLAGDGLATVPARMAAIAQLAVAGANDVPLIRIDYKKLVLEKKSRSFSSSIVFRSARNLRTSF